MPFRSFSSGLGLFFDLQLFVNQIKDGFGYEGYDRPGDSEGLGSYEGSVQVDCLLGFSFILTLHEKTVALFLDGFIFYFGTFQDFHQFAPF